MDGVTPEQVGPLLASNQIVLYELTQEGGNLESVFLSLTSGLGFGDVVAPEVTPGPSPATPAATPPPPPPMAP
jgi:hypothetical protein